MPHERLLPAPAAPFVPRSNVVVAEGGSAIKALLREYLDLAYSRTVISHVLTSSIDHSAPRHRLTDQTT
jgi:hypothetical protein